MVQFGFLEIMGAKTNGEEELIDDLVTLCLFTSSNWCDNVNAKAEGGADNSMWVDGDSPFKSLNFTLLTPET